MCNGVPLAKSEEDYYVYDIYEFVPQYSYKTMSYHENFEFEDSDQDGAECDYPDEDEYDYEEYDYYRDWQDEEDYKLKEEFEKFDFQDTSSEESFY
jgi:hypothetical protein